MRLALLLVSCCSFPALGCASISVSASRPENRQAEALVRLSSDPGGPRPESISTGALPSACAVLYWLYSPSRADRLRAVGLSGAVVIETLVIFLLLHTLARRRRAEVGYRRKQTEFSEVQRLAQLGSWHWNPKTDVFTCSDSLDDLIGLDPESPPSPLGQLSRFFEPKSWEQLTAEMHRILHTPETFRLELEVPRANGFTRWVAIRGEPVRDRDGHVVQLRGTMQDVTERKLAEEARLKHAPIVESSEDAIISTNLGGCISSWNAGAQHMFGYTETEAVGQPITTLVPPEVQDQENAILRRVQAGEHIEHYETVRMSKAGKKIFVSLSISPIMDSKGGVVGTAKIARAITQQKLAEEELKKSEEQFSKAFRQNPIMLTLSSANDHRYIDVNEAFERLTGYRREEGIGRSALELGISVNNSEWAKIMEQAAAGGSVRGVELEYRTRDGRTGIAQASAQLIQIDGKPCVLAATIDITDRKRAERALQESENRFRLMADSAPVLMWVSGPDKRCTDFNKEWLNFTGRTMLQELGDGWSHGIHPDDLEASLHTYSQAFDGRQSFSMEYRLRRHDGLYRWVLNRGTPRFLEERFAGYIGCCIDITEQKEAKAVQAELSGRLMQAQEEERARIAGELHDDINQRLALLANGIQELEQRLDSQNGSEEERHQLHTFWQLTSEIAADIQHLSHRLHPSKLHYLGLSAAMRGLCQEFSKRHKIEIDCVVRDLPSGLDENVSLSLFRAAQESLRNITKHSGAHHAKVELVCDHNNVTLRISDDGVGFDYEQAKKGPGLGLASMQERLKLVGGKFSIWSRPSLGTQIVGTIPLTSKYVRST
jgi:PAS domain S-box-containing protein